MKYTYIVVSIVFAFFLTGCFAKPVVEEVETSLTPQEINEDNTEIIESDVNESEDTTSTGSEIESGEQEEDVEEKNRENTEIETEIEIETETEVEGETEEQSDAKKIEEFSKELQELFNDVDNIGS